MGPCIVQRRFGLLAAGIRHACYPSGNYQGSTATTQPHFLQDPPVVAHHVLSDPMCLSCGTHMLLVLCLSIRPVHLAVSLARQAATVAGFFAAKAFASKTSAIPILLLEGSSRFCHQILHQYAGIQPVTTRTHSFCDGHFNLLNSCKTCPLLFGRCVHIRVH